MHDLSAELDTRWGQGRWDFRDLFELLKTKLFLTSPVSLGEWQSQATDAQMRELLHVCFEWQMPRTPGALAQVTGARLPWAEDHFLERVGGEPLNPAPSEAWWPFASKKEGTNVAHKSEGEAFSHTYPERMWPKWANVPQDLEPATGYPQNSGIRFDYGDLDDVVNQLVRSPNTRQAYLPIWFPEDTGAVHGKRVPCTLGYHFIIRNGRLDISYFMRSTDMLRHFQDDVYLAVRLAQWVAEQWNDRAEATWDEPIQPGDELRVGSLIFHTANMHIFEQDVPLMQYWEQQGRLWF
jgi:hypothetical protein